MIGSNLIRYPFVATRARGIFANFLKKEDYSQLLKADSLGEAEKILRKLYPVHATHASGADAMALEDRVRDHFLDIVGQMRRGLASQDAAFVGAIVAQYEVYNIKALLRGRIMGNPTEVIREEMIPLGSMAAMDWDELLAEDEVPEILHLLQEHPLGAGIERAYKNRYLKGNSIYRMDAQIDVEYMTWLYDRASSLAKDGKALQRLAGLQVDVANVVWLLRYRENFELAPEQIMVELVPRGHHLKPAILRKLVFTEDIKQVVAMLRAYPWGKYLPLQRNDLPSIERGLEAFLKEQYYRVFRSNPLQLAGVFAFVLLARAVAEDVVKILEGTEYRLDKDRLRSELFYANR